MIMIGMTSQATRCRTFFSAIQYGLLLSLLLSLPLIVSSTCVRMISCRVEKHWGAGQYSSLIFNFSILFFNL